MSDAEVQVQPVCLLTRAYLFAAERHARQTRKGATEQPYINHLVEVADLVAEATDDTSLPKVERKRLQVVQAPGKTPCARILKLADKISNLSALDEPILTSATRAAVGIRHLGTSGRGRIARRQSPARPHRCPLPPTPASRSSGR